MALPDTDALPLPSAALLILAPGITLQPPLSRRGHGPGLILVTPYIYNDSHHLDPLPLQKWAEEGYATAQICVEISDSNSDSEPQGEETLFTAPHPVRDQVYIAIQGLSDLKSCDNYQGIFIVAYVNEPMLLITLSKIIEESEKIAGLVSYSSASNKTDDHLTVLCQKSHLYQISGKRDELSKPLESRNNKKFHEYPTTKSHNFIIPGHPDYDSAAAALAHTRALTFMKPIVGGPYFDLEAIWEEHCKYEFEERDVAKTMATMVQEPYVNHVPTMTGGVGRAALTEFYTNHFIFSNPDDAGLQLISRTVGSDRVVDEFVYCCTHTRNIDWLIPGIPPTNLPLRIPMVAIVNIRGDRLFHEHISWDQGTVLVQLGLMPEYLPFTTGIGIDGSQMEYRVPMAGLETAQKLEDEGCVDSNGMLGFVVREMA